MQAMQAMQGMLPASLRYKNMARRPVLTFKIISDTTGVGGREYGLQVVTEGKPVGFAFRACGLLDHVLGAFEIWYTGQLLF